MSISCLIDAKSCVSASRALAQASSMFCLRATPEVAELVRDSKGAPAGRTTALTPRCARRDIPSRPRRARPARQLLDDAHPRPRLCCDASLELLPCSARISRCTCLLKVFQDHAIVACAALGLVEMGIVRPPASREAGGEEAGAAGRGERRAWCFWPLAPRDAPRPAA